MKQRRFLISSLAAAGFVKPFASDAAIAPADGADAAKPSLEPAIFHRFSQEHLFNLASHSSHSSHASHASHSSGSSGYTPYRAPVYTPPAAVYTRPAPTYVQPAPLYAPPATATPTTLKGNSTTFTSIVRQVQLALHAFGYYDSTIDGVVGATTRAAITRLQTDYQLRVTGTITPEVLDALRVAAR